MRLAVRRWSARASRFRCCSPSASRSTTSSDGAKSERKFSVLADAARIATIAQRIRNRRFRFRRATSPRSREIHRAYSGRFNVTAIRDETDWRANLRFAGNQPMIRAKDGRNISDPARDRDGRYRGICASDAVLRRLDGDGVSAIGLAMPTRCSRCSGISAKKRRERRLRSAESVIITAARSCTELQNAPRGLHWSRIPRTIRNWKKRSPKRDARSRITSTTTTCGRCSRRNVSRGGSR